MSVLQCDGELVSRRERFAYDDPVQALSGPLLLPSAIRDVDDSCIMDICRSCHSILARKHNSLPRSALANGLWLGDVPSVLQCFTFVEQMLVAKVP